VPLTRRQILRRRRVTVFGGLGVVLATAFYLPFTLLAPLSTSAAQVLPWKAPVTAAPTLDWPSYGASAIGAIDFPGILASSGSTDPLPIASISKVVTALVVLEHKPLGVDDPGPDISFTSADVKLYSSYLHRNGKVEPVHAGIVLSQRQVMELTLVASANNYAASLVNWAFGSEAAFLPVARSWLDAHGLKNTFMSDATGMSPENRATATDLVELGKIALADPIVSVLVDTAHISIPGVGEINNTNDLLGQAGVRGIKTGTLDEAGACLLFAADYQIGSTVVTVVGVMLGGADHPSLDRDIRTLLATAQSGFHEVALTAAGADYASYSTLWGDKSDVVATKNASVVIWADTPITLLVQAAPVTLEPAGTDVGSLSFSVGTRTIEVPLELKSGIEDPGVWWRLTHPTELF
jgi:D-alanyl-D-alanine carboxypeptidase (penicillin-binding protein 5/6)